MGNAIVPFTAAQLPVVSDEQINALEKVSTNANFLPRLQLISKGKYVDTGKVPPGRWGVPTGDECADLGPEVDIIPLAVRDKALDVSDRDNIISVYDKESDEFKRIKDAPKNTGCMWGRSFLVLERKTEKLYELYFGNASGRAEAGKVEPFLPRPKSPASALTLKIKYKKGKDFSWHVPVVVACSEPLTGGPDMDEVVKQIDKFNNPDEGPEVAEEPATKRAR
jgi:hypothetical protein